MVRASVAAMYTTSLSSLAVIERTDDVSMINKRV